MNQPGILFVVCVLFLPDFAAARYFDNCPKNFSEIVGYRILKAIKFLIPKGVEGKEDLIRIGSTDGDGGYVMLDDLLNISVAYSFGISDEWSFDSHLSKNGIPVYMFDPFNLKGKRAADNNSLLKFYGLGIKGSGDKRVLHKHTYENSTNLLTLEEILSLDNNSNQTKMVLKMDVEGWEWDVFSGTPSSTLNKFSQIAAEFHWLDKMVASEKNFTTLMNALENLNRTHQLIWINAHNGVDYCVLGGVPIPLCFEATFVRRDLNIKFKKYDRKRKRADARNIRSRGNFLLWWIDGGMEADYDLLASSYHLEESNSTSTPLSQHKKNSKHADL